MVELKDTYPLYLANEAKQPNADLEVTDKYTGKVAFRCAQADAKTIDAGSVRIDLARHLVSIRGEPVNLTRSEFQVLRLLAERPGQVFSRLEIMEELWQSEFSGDVRACDVHISNLRQKIERDPQDPELVLTVRGVGYRLAEG